MAEADSATAHSCALHFPGGFHLENYFAYFVVFQSVHPRIPMLKFVQSLKKCPASHCAKRQRDIVC